MAQVRLQALEKRFGTLKALDGVTLTIGEGELFALLGSSGSGKTTAPPCVAGLEQPDAGGHSSIGLVLGARPAAVRRAHSGWCSRVTRSSRTSHRLPQRRVRPACARLRGRAVPSARRARRAPPPAAGCFRPRPSCAARSATRSRWRPPRARPITCPATPAGSAAARCARSRYCHRSGRAALRRAPVQPRSQAARQHALDDTQAPAAAPITALYVTHDQEEALSLADRMAIMDHGRVVQLGTPARIHHRPATAFVADFIGAENLVPGEIVAHEGGDAIVSCGGLRIRAAGLGPRERCPARIPSGRKVRAVVRPQSITLAPKGAPAGRRQPLRRRRALRRPSLGTAARYEVGDGRHDVRRRRSRPAPWRAARGRRSRQPRVRGPQRHPAPAPSCQRCRRPGPPARPPVLLHFQIPPATVAILLVFGLFLLVPFATILIVSFTGRPVAVLDALTGLEGVRRIGGEISANASLRYFEQLVTFPRYVRAFANSMSLGIMGRHRVGAGRDADRLRAGAHQDAGRASDSRAVHRAAHGADVHLVLRVHPDVRPHRLGEPDLRVRRHRAARRHPPPFGIGLVQVSSSSRMRCCR